MDAENASEFEKNNPPAPPVAGIINLDKPAGISSAAAVARVKRLLPRKTRIGHAGTLDPFATGVLLLLVGKATRWCETLMSSPKQYETVVTLGGVTETDDLDSPVTARPVNQIPTRGEIEAALAPMVGIIQQRPPAYSALKVGGQRAYKLARAGETIQLPPRPVRIDRIEVLDYAWPNVRLRIDCGRGVYIRSIARDLGETVGVGGYLTQLRRTRIGSFAIAEAVTLEQLQRDGVQHFLQNIAMPS